MMISVAMIVKNEITTLERTLASVRDVASTVVIGVDEQSDDGTLELAEKLADKVIPVQLSEELAKKAPANGGQEWGFSRARNIVLDACPEESWRLILDGHEIVHTPEKLNDAVDAALLKKCDGVFVTMHFERRKDGIAATMYPQARLLSPSVRYRNPIHNVPLVSRVHQARDVVIEHCKKDQDKASKLARDVQRSDSSINGLRKQVAANPGESRSLFYLGCAYKENSRWHEALTTFQQYLEVGKWKEERWHARVNMATCYSYLKDVVKAREQFSRAIDEFPVMAEAYYWLGETSYKQGQFQEALVWLERCVDMEVPECMLFVNPRVYLVERHDLLGMVYSHLGRYADAVAQGDKALEAAPNPRIEKNVRVWKNILEARHVK